MPQSKEHSAFLDLVRGLSAQLVLLGHALIFAYPSYYMTHDAAGRLVPAAGHFYPQLFAVVAFFTISGILVTASAVQGLQAGGYSFGRFLIERAARIFVPLLPALLLVYLGDNLLFPTGHRPPFLDGQKSDGVTLLFNAAMLQVHPALTLISKLAHLTPIGGFGSDGPLWTVAFEWWLYVSFGIGFLLLAQGKRVSPPLWALLMFALMVPVVSLTRSGLVLAWIIGMAATLGRARLMRLSRGAVAFGAGASLALLTLAYLTLHDAYNAAVVVPFALLIVFLWLLADKLPSPTGAISTIVAWLARYSYSLYLVHFPVLAYLSSAGLQTSVAVTVIVCNLAGLLHWYLFERHYRRVATWLDRLFLSQGESKIVLVGGDHRV